MIRSPSRHAFSSNVELTPRRGVCASRYAGDMQRHSQTISSNIRTRGVLPARLAASPREGNRIVSELDGRCYRIAADHGLAVSPQWSARSRSPQLDETVKAVPARERFNRAGVFRAASDQAMSCWRSRIRPPSYRRPGGLTIPNVSAIIRDVSLGHPISPDHLRAHDRCRVGRPRIAGAATPSHAG
jgi:hypothetical protein